MGHKIKIGSWQGPISENDFDRNLEKVKSVLHQTRDQELDFLCFPECYLSGYSPQAISESSVSLDDTRLVRFIEESRQYDTVILVGMSERKDGKIYNTQLIVYEGKVLGTSHKTLLTGYDKNYFVTNLELPVFEVKEVKFGVAICHTTSYVEPALCLRWKGARLLFTPHFNKISPEGFRSAGQTITFTDHRTMVLNNQSALATLLKMVVVRSNVVVISEEGLGAGDSNIWDMEGNVVAQGKPFMECLVTAEFDKKIFLEEHWIDRGEVPSELCDMIAQASKDYNRI